MIEVILRDRFTERAAELGQRLKDGLLALQQRYECIGDVRGRGLLLGLDLVKDRRSKTPDPELAQRVARECLAARHDDRRWCAADSASSASRRRSRLNAAEIDLGLEIFDKALSRAHFSGLKPTPYTVVPAGVRFLLLWLE